MDVAEATEREAAVADAATIEASMERETMAAGMKVTVATDMEAAERAPVATVTEAAKREALAMDTVTIVRVQIVRDVQAPEG